MTTFATYARTVHAIVAANRMLPSGPVALEQEPPDTLLLLPERVPTMRPPFILVHPSTLRPGDIYLERGRRWVEWRVITYVRTYRHPVSNVPQHIYLMECLTGGERGQKQLVEASDMQNVALTAGLRYGYACRRTEAIRDDKERRHLYQHITNVAFSVYCRLWRELEQAA